MTSPDLILGTAMWAWTTPKETCFQLLDHFYEAGFREVDAATNYPLNGNTAQFRAAENILLEWIQANGVQDLKVMMKVGSLTNVRTPDNNLSKSFLLMMLDEYQHLFGSNLDTYMLHWDNRSEKDEIIATLEALAIAKEKGLQVGLSGIKFPSVYAELNASFGFDFRIQIKHNLLQSAYTHYQGFHAKAKFITYGINAGGIKLDQKYDEQSSLKVRGGNTQEEPKIIYALRNKIKAQNENLGDHPITNFNQCGMTYAFHSPDIQGILIGTSKLAQLEASIQFHQLLKEGTYQAFYEALKELHEEV
jgi:aryl-alcohol dehydrogenase-like predicted oxidoreductase